MGVVAQAVWAHPEHGTVLAILTDTSDVSLFVESIEAGKARMQLIAFFSNQHITALDFGPNELGLQMATASTDGRVRCKKPHSTANWDSPEFDAILPNVLPQRCL